MVRGVESKFMLRGAQRFAACLQSGDALQCMLRAFNLEMLFSVCCVPIDCVGETILRGECFLRKELVYLGVKTSVETAGEA